MSDPFKSSSMCQKLILIEVALLVSKESARISPSFPFDALTDCSPPCSCAVDKSQAVVPHFVKSVSKSSKNPTSIGSTICSNSKLPPTTFKSKISWLYPSEFPLQTGVPFSALQISLLKNRLLSRTLDLIRSEEHTSELQSQFHLV